MTEKTLNRCQVRDARLEDASTLAGLFEQLGYAGALPGLEARLGQQLANPAARVLVATIDGSVAGALVLHVFAPLHVAQPWAVISSLVVDDRSRSHGAGAALVGAAEELARERDCAHLELSCSERRTRAHAFYEAQGFVEVRKRFKKQLAPAA